MTKLVGAILACAVLLVSSAAMADSLTIGKAVPFAWSFVPADVGLEAGIWKKHGFDDVKIIGFQGEAKLQQALFSKDIEFGLASGPGMAFDAKGGAGIGIAAFFGAPRNVAIAMPPDAKFSGLAQLQGKKLGGTTAGSLSDWLTQRLSQSQGWGPKGITFVGLGGMDANLAAMKTGQVDGILVTPESAYDLQDKGQLKLVYNFATLVPKFITNVVYTRKDMLPSQADKVKRFVDAFFETVAYMRANKAKTVEISARVLHSSESAMERTYDDEMPAFSANGVFDKESVATLAESFIGMGLLDKRPPDNELFTTQFVPAH